MQWLCIILGFLCGVALVYGAWGAAAVCLGLGVLVAVLGVRREP